MDPNPYLPEDLEALEESHLSMSMKEYIAARALLHRSRRVADIITCAQVTEAIVTIKSELDRREAERNAA